MKINNNNSINFTAKYISSAKVSNYIQKSKRYAQKEVSFVELNPHDTSDLAVLDRIADSWEYDKFSVNIYNSAYDIYKKALKTKDRIYALTTQSDKFEALDYRKVLGLTDMRLLNKKEIYISHIQVNPEYVYSLKPEYKGSGSAILKSLQNMYTKITLFSLPEKSVKNFYKRNGFVQAEDSKNKFTWKKKKSLMDLLKLF